MTVYDWSTIQREELNPLFARQVIHGDLMTVARVFLKKGCLVPEHSHVNEQLSVLEQGQLDFVVGGQPVTVKAGEVLRIPSNVPHSAYAAEDAVSMDIFSGVREDWRDGTDAYLRR
jgi:quercetin dioxygenase-like cupin family protein